MKILRIESETAYKDIKILILILLTALIVRIAVISVFNSGMWVAPDDISHFQINSLSYARTNKFLILCSKSGIFTYPTIYPFIMGTLYKMAGETKIIQESILVPQAFNVILNLISIILFYLIIRKLNPESKNLHFPITLIFALYPDSILYNLINSPQIMLMFLVLLILFLSLLKFRLRYFIIGIITAIGVIMKFYIIGLPLIFLGIKFISMKERLKNILINIILFAISLSLSLFFLLSNERRQNEFFNLNIGIYLYIGNNSMTDEKYTEPESLPLFNRDVHKGHLNTVSAREAILYISDNPLSVINNIPLKTRHYLSDVSSFRHINAGYEKGKRSGSPRKPIWWRYMPNYIVSNWVYILSYIYFLAVLIIFLIFLALFIFKSFNFRYSQGIYYVLFTVVYFMLINTVLFAGSNDYNILIIVFMLLFMISWKKYSCKTEQGN